MKLCCFVNASNLRDSMRCRKSFREELKKRACTRTGFLFSNCLLWRVFRRGLVVQCSLSSWRCSRRIYLKATALLVLCTILPYKTPSETVREDKTEKPAVFKTPGGTEYVDFRVGTGDKPSWGDMVVIHYVIYTVEGGSLRKFYSTYDDKEPFAFRHGNGQTIKGLEEGVDSMRVGGRRRMVIPGSLAYTVAGLGPIPPSTSVRKKLGDSLKQGNILAFDVELVKIWKDPVGMEYYTDFVPDVSKIPRSMFLKK
jgi:FKBP-type peptidyl-prolyl cis-trans isomerase